jgi:hypothetical protein
MILCLAIFFLLAMPVNAQSADYYVKTSANGGNDTNSGASWSTAKATIQGAMDLATNLGDKVNVAAGTYNEKVAFPDLDAIQLLGGYLADGGGTRAPWTNTTIIDGSGAGTTGPMIDVPYAADHRGYFGIVIDGFTVRNGTDNSSYGAGGIKSWTSGVTIRNCIIEDNNASSFGLAGGIYIACGHLDNGNPVIEKNIIRNNNASGGPGGISFDGAGAKSWNYNAAMTNTLIYGNTGSVGGVHVFYPGGVTITNCTIADNAVPGINIAGYSAIESGQASIKNTVVWHPSGDDIYVTSGGWLTSLSYSDVHDTGDTGTGVIHTNPAFAGASDYHLTSSSGGCIDGGTASGAPGTDLEGTSRPQGGGDDMGCYEYMPASEPDITVTDDKGTTNDQQVPFGNVTENESADATVTITNDGTENLNIGTITDPSAPFSINATACSSQTLTPGQSCNCTVTFAPTATGTFNDSFDIPSNDPDENPVTVSVSGTGTAAPAPDITVTDNKGATDDLQVPFGNVTESESSDATVTITNGGDLDLDIGDIASANSLAPPFTIDATACSSQTLTPGQSCNCTVTFAPTATGTFDDSFDIPSNDPDENPVTVSVSGTGVSATVQYTLTVIKTGQGTVTPDPGDHDYDAGTVVDLTATADEGWTFDGWNGDVADVDDETTTIPMNSDESVTVTFAADDDNDGVPDEAEQGPDGNDATYDGNDDGTPDYHQDNVASGHTHDNSYYITLAVPSGETLSNTQTNDNPSPSDSPSGVNFPYGFIEFTINNVTVGGATTATLYLDTAGSVPTTYYKYGPTPTDGTDHWYEFMYDGETGAEINNREIALHFVDGERGDDDLTANGTIIDQGAPGNPSSGGDDSSSNCFIATAAYGSYMEPHVLVLRDFRDRFLLNNSVGNAFVRLYYTCSPPVADFIAKHGVLRAVVRIGLLPFVGMSYMALHTTALQKIMLILIASGFLLTVGMGIRRFRRRESLS